MSAGEVFLAAFVGILFTKLSAPGLWKFINKKSFQKELVKWRRTLQMLQAVLNEAEEKQLTDQTFATEALQHKLMVGDEASTSRVQKLVTAIFTRLNPSAVKFHGRMRCKIRGITCRLNDTMTKLDEEKMKILELVLQKATRREADFVVIPIVGMGSVGKTTLAQVVMHDLVNDLARWAAGETYFGPEDELEAHLQPEIYKRSRHSSSTRDDYDGIKNLKRLRVLSWSGYNISELPSSIGELKLLRKIGHGIEELMDLNFLCGTLCISRLENVVDHRRARQASLPEKQDLESLVLKWSSDITYSRDERIEKDVLDMLQPHQGLQELTINFYSSTRFPSWVGDPSFSNMVLLSLENCENCTSVPALGLLKSLKDFSITGMSGLQSIGREIYGECCSNPFPSLETLYFKDMPGWKYWHANGEEQVEVFPRLHKLSILNCSQCLMEEGKDANISSPSLLEYLDIRNCPSLKCLLSRGQLPAPLRQLVIWDCPELGSIAEAFCNISPEQIEIKYCGKFACLPEGPNMLSHLQENTICNCSSILSFPEGGFPATSLRKLYMGWCEKLKALPERLRSLTSLVELDILTRPSTVSFPQVSQRT
ncbi:hypothetical protein POTOM_000179 [Populus tomentosa]|uniref:R13L1/DRL21-like LRR repeat region domain-containing protein n=1 Tax=Populus tomentosa TaxID=118781 RepID=A0A8X8AMH3_POPTO|nr:hypothetical protein POTOM_000179 [Populus tomentosa]